jgi:Predicted acyltransferases
VFGLLPKAQISVVGVGWFLGIVFVFYMLFPFYVFLMYHKRRAWMVMGISILLNVLCRFYFFDEAHVGAGFPSRANILYSSMFFVAGGLIYLYKEELTRIKYANVFSILLSVGLIAVYYTVLYSEYILLLLFSFVLIYGIVGKSHLLSNRIVRFMSSISMEIYLCHMFVFRLLTRIHVTHMTSNEVLNYLIVCITTIAGAIAVSLMITKTIELLENQWKKLRCWSSAH